LFIFRFGFILRGVMLLTADEVLIARTLVVGRTIRGRELSSMEVIQVNAALEARGDASTLRALIAEYRGDPTPKGQSC
jgi:hypothetical protein